LGKREWDAGKRKRERASERMGNMRRKRERLKGGWVVLIFYLEKMNS
jgi:hypothetical protein